MTRFNFYFLINYRLENDIIESDKEMFVCLSQLHTCCIFVVRKHTDGIDTQFNINCTLDSPKEQLLTHKNISRLIAMVSVHVLFVRALNRDKLTI